MSVSEHVCEFVEGVRVIGGGATACQNFIAVCLLGQWRRGRAWSALLWLCSVFC